jgi:uncharacterized membrane protein YbhN (UPF0104 family)
MLAGVLVRISELDHKVLALGMIPAFFTGTLVAWCSQWIFPHNKWRQMAIVSLLATLGILALGLYLVTMDEGIGFIDEIRGNPTVYVGAELLASVGVLWGFVVPPRYLGGLQLGRWKLASRSFMGGAEGNQMPFRSVLSQSIFRRIRSKFGGCYRRPPEGRR